MYSVDKNETKAGTRLICARTCTVPILGAALPPVFAACTAAERMRETIIIVVISVDVPLSLSLSL